jgi:hypothetical protein
MIVLRFLDAVSQGIGICWIIAVLKARALARGSPSACDTRRERVAEIFHVPIRRLLELANAD